ncbi:MAG: site-2 protease family protein [Planctomycetes bacterium]|nr:site-2 protease family protein [Planctomycetota bacterium]
MSNLTPTDFIVWYAVFLFSTTFHEAMHSFVSHYGGDSTAHAGGQVTLNPVPHIRRSPFGMVVVPIITFLLARGAYMIGWASAPFNPYWAARYPKRSFWMSLAGPLSHLPLIVVSFVAMYIGLRNGFFHPIGYDDFLTGMYPVAMGDSNISWALAKLVNTAFKLNLLLLIFNLLPLPPLDGSEVWYLFVKREEDRLRYRMMSAQYSLAGLMLAWWLFPKIYYPAFGYAVNALYGLTSY